MARKKKTRISKIVSGASDTIATVRGLDYDRIFPLVAGIFISVMSAYYSVIGLAAIFSGSADAVMVMGTALEIGKIITASYLYRNWQKLNILLKSYFLGAVVILMAITSMGTFGYLSKAHIEQSFVSGGTQASVDRINRQIARENTEITRAETALAQLDAAVNSMIGQDYATRGLTVRRSQIEERTALNATIDTAEEKIESLEEELAPYQTEIRRLEQEVGPIRYVAELIYGESNTTLLDKAVRWMIILLVFVFDPLAVLLIMVSTRGDGSTSFRLEPRAKEYEKDEQNWLKHLNPITQTRRVKMAKANDLKPWDTTIEIDINQVDPPSREKKWTPEDDEPGGLERLR